MRPQTNKPWRKGLRRVPKNETRTLAAIQAQRSHGHQAFVRPALTVIQGGVAA